MIAWEKAHKGQDFLSIHLGSDGMFFGRSWRGMDAEPYYMVDAALSLTDGRKVNSLSCGMNSSLSDPLHLAQAPSNAQCFGS